MTTEVLLHHRRPYLLKTENFLSHQKSSSLFEFLSTNLIMLGIWRPRGHEMNGYGKFLKPLRHKLRIMVVNEVWACFSFGIFVDRSYNVGNLMPKKYATASGPLDNEWNDGINLGLSRVRIGRDDFQRGFGWFIVIILRQTQPHNTAFTATVLFDTAQPKKRRRKDPKYDDDEILQEAGNRHYQPQQVLVHLDFDAAVDATCSSIRWRHAE